MPVIKVLLADDELTVLEILAKKIASAGYEVVTAVNGKDAWEKIQTTYPDVVILDLIMPEMDGISVLSKLRSDFNSKKWIPVIIVSALGEMSNLQRAYDLQADHYLVKPCKIEEILKSIRIMLSLAPLRN